MCTMEQYWKSGRLWAAFCFVFTVGLTTLVAAQEYQAAPPADAAQAKAMMEAAKAAARAGQPPGATPADAKPGESKDKAGEKKDDDTSKSEPGKDEKDESKAPEPVKRPSEPPAPPNPDELKVRPGPDGKFQFSFTGQPWQGVLQWLADISQMNFDWQELPGDYLNLTTQHAYSVSEARDLINSCLLDRGYTLLRGEDKLSVVKLDSLNPGVVPRVEPEDLDQRDPFEFVKVSFPLDSLLADKAVEELAPMKSKYGKLTALEDTNRIEALDTVLNLREIRDILKAEQSVQTQERTVELFELEYAEADDVRNQLLSLLGIESKSSTGPMTREQMRQIQQAIQQAQQKKNGAAEKEKKEPQVNIVVDERRNSILVNAPPDKMAIIRQAIQALDVPANEGESPLVAIGRMHTYRLAVLEPEALVKSIEAMGFLDPRSHLEVDNDNKAVIAQCSAVEDLMIRTLIDKLDGSSREFHVIQLRRLAADEVAGTIQFMMVGGEEKETNSRSYYPWYGSSRQSNEKEEKDKFCCEPDIERNQIILKANEIELEQVNDLLVKLGELPPEGGNRSKVRVLESTWSPETEEWLERVRRAWPSVAPNPLELPADEAKPSEPQPKKKDVQTADATAASPVPSSFVQLAQLRRETSDESKTADAATTETTSQTPNPKNPKSQDPSPSDAAPIEITRGPDGRIVIRSDDTRALDMLEDLMRSTAPARSNRKIYRLRYAWPDTVAATLREIFKEEEDRPMSWYDRYYGRQENDEPLRLSKRRPLKFIYDLDSRSIVVQNADQAQLAQIDELVEFYDQPEPNDSESIRQQKIFELRYAKAEDVATAIKDIYRDLLSPNDKALAGSPQQESRRTYYYFDSYGSGDDQQKAPRYKGLLTVAVYEPSTLAVSAPVFLMKEITPLVERLDEMAKPTAEAVDVVQVDSGVNMEELQEKLNSLTGGESSGGGSRDRSRYDRSRRGDRR